MLDERLTCYGWEKDNGYIGVTADVEGGKVFLPRHAGWLEDFRYELETFPHARHDDWVDSVVQYLEWVRAGEKGARIGRPILLPLPGNTKRFIPSWYEPGQYMRPEERDH